MGNFDYLLVGFGFILILGIIILVLKVIWEFATRGPEFFTDLVWKLTGHSSENIGKVIVGIVIGIIATWVISYFVDEGGRIQRALGLVILGILVVIGILWQWVLIAFDMAKWNDGQLPYRILAGTTICILLFLGVVIRGVFLIYYDDRVAYEFAFLIRDIANFFLFSVIFLLKSYFAAAITMFGIALALYFFLEYRIISPVIVLEPVLNQVVSLAPSGIQDIYVAAFSVYAVGMSFVDTIS
jgi:hypothetical protein